MTSLARRTFWFRARAWFMLQRKHPHYIGWSWSLLALASITSLSSCTPSTYSKPGVSAVDFESDYVDCEVKAGQSGTTDFFPRRGFIDRCLRSKGWSPS